MEELLMALYNLIEKKRKEKRKITFKGITSGSAEVQKSLKILKKAINKVLGSSVFNF